MTNQLSDTGFPDPPGPLRHLLQWARERSTWFTRAFGILLVLILSVKYAFDYYVGNAPGVARTFDYLTDKVFILLGFFVLLLGAIAREYIVSRKERYANVFDRTEAISAGLRDLTTYLNNIDGGSLADKEQFQKLVRNELASVLDNIGELFSMVTGTTCRVALKCAFLENDNIYVYAVTRDKQSNRNNLKNDKDRFQNRTDQLIDNEDFYSIFNHETPWYIEHNLVRKRDYRNSSFKIYGRPSTRLNPLLNLIYPNWGWTLPYKSTMVFPIQQLESPNLQFDSWGCIGFLAIDSAFAGVFKPRFDGPLGASLANAFFAPLARYVALLDQTGANGVTHVRNG